jgi:ATP-dependent DNA helicase 2 subunit 2
MSRKETTTVLIETSSYMNNPVKKEAEQTFLSLSYDCLSTMCEQKLLYCPKTHEVGLLTFGETCELKREYSQVTVDFLKSIATLKEEEATKSSKSDPFTAIEEALFNYKKAYPKKGPAHKIVLFTTLECKSTFTQDSAQELSKFLRAGEVKLSVILCRNEGDNTNPSSIYTKNKGLMDYIITSTDSILTDAATAHELYRQLRSRTQMLVVKYRGVLEITPDLKIGVCSYTKSTKEDLDSLKKFSKLAENPENQLGKGDVKIIRSFYEHDDPQLKTVPDEQVIKAFYYGRQIVPIPKDKRDEMKVVDDKQIRLLCYTDEKSLPRHFLLAGVDVIIPTPDDKNIVAFNSIVDAMLEAEKVGIVRYIMRNNTPPKLAALFAKKSKTGVRTMYLSLLPTAEDIRDYRFAKLKESTEEEKALVEQLVDRMDLMNFIRPGLTEPYEALKPSETFNPIIQRMNQNIIARGVHGRQDIAPINDETMEEICPERVTHQRAQEISDEIRRAFGLEEHDIERVNARARIYWQQLIHSHREQEGERERELTTNAEKKNGGGDGDDYVKDISMIHPVSDFNDMRRNKKVDLVEQALKKMAGIIERLIQESIRGSYYEKALECLSELRRGSLEEDEYTFFNEFLRKLRAKYRQGAHRAFWRSVVKKGLSLISSSELRISDVKEEDSLAFLQDEEEMMDRQMDMEDLPRDDELGDIE